MKTFMKAGTTSSGKKPLINQNIVSTDSTIAYIRVVMSMNSR